MNIRESVRVFNEAVKPMDKTEAILTVGSGLSNTSKMPSFSFNLSALDCVTGSKLVNIEGSVCFGCYALKGSYRRYKHIYKMQPKTEKIDNEKWVDAMVYLIEHQGNTKDRKFFRWHDSGDIQSLQHLRKIVLVCEDTPNVKHWLPTREYKLIKMYLKIWKKFPTNLTVRLSAHMIDQKAPKIANLPTSTVNKDKLAVGTQCESYKQENQCLDCRKCWDKSNTNISYKYH